MSDATGDAHDTRKDALVMIRPPAWLGSFLTSFYWFPVRQGDNSWIIHNVRSPNKVLSFAFGFNARLKCSSVLKDSMAGARRERWALRRSGKDNLVNLSAWNVGLIGMTPSRLLHPE